MSGIDAAREFVAEARRILRPKGVLFVVVPDYLKERQFFWDIDYTHNFITTERRVRQLLYDGGFDISRVVRSIGAATGPARDALAAGAILANLPGLDALSRYTRTEDLLFRVQEKSVRDAGVRSPQNRLTAFFTTPWCPPSGGPSAVRLPQTVVSGVSRTVSALPSEKSGVQCDDVMAQVYAAKYLAKAALSAPRDLINAYVATVRPIHPTVLIFHCTWVCDAQCEMCHNWKRADRKHEMSLADIDRVFSSGLWKNIETANVSGGEPTTRNDLVEVCEVMLNRLPRLRKFGINTTGLTPHRAIPMLTKIVELCNKRGVIFSTRVSIDGVGDMHNDVRHVKNGFNKANETIRAMRELQKKFTFNFGISTTIFSQNLDDAENILSWARSEKLDIVFNMVRFTDAMLGNGDLSDTCKPLGPKEEQMRQFFLDRVRMDPLLDGQNYIYLHYADMIANGYHRLSPCPFQTQGIMLNPDGGMFFCENSDVVGNVLTEDAEDLYFKAASQEHRDWVKEKKCPSCLSPCQMNVAAVKQVAPYVKFLVRASAEKRKHRARVAEAVSRSLDLRSILGSDPRFQISVF